MLFVLIAFLAAAFVTLMVVHGSTKLKLLAADHDLSGPQKFHARPVPRIGGVGIYIGISACAIVMWWQGVSASMGFMLLLSGLPAFTAGLVEDFTKKVSPGKRLAATALSAALGGWLMSALIAHTSIPGLDWVVSYGAGAMLVTVFVVAGVANSVNIIDGFNGLSSMCVCLMLAAYAYVAYQVGDTELVLWALVGVGAVLGFFIWNFPAGLIFLGDGGAYFMGFFLAEIGVLLISRHPDVSPLLALMVCIYPVFETIFSIYRRRFLRNTPPGLPDGIHLHSLIYRRLMRWALGGDDARALTRRNSLTAPYLWVLCLFSLMPAVLFWRSTAVLAVCMLLFAVVYVGVYWRIVRFQTPGWLLVRSRRKGGRARKRQA